MKEKFDAYALAKKFQNWIVDRSIAHDFTVNQIIWGRIWLIFEKDFQNERFATFSFLKTAEWLEFQPHSAVLKKGEKLQIMNGFWKLA